MPTRLVSIPYYASSSAATGAAPTWFNTGNASGAPNGTVASATGLGTSATARLYASGFTQAGSYPQYYTVYSAQINVVHRQPSGAVGDTTYGQFHWGLHASQANLITQTVVNMPTGAPFQTISYDLPAAVVTSGLWTNPNFYLSAIYSGVANNGGVDVDSIYLTVTVDDRPVFYKTSSLIRNGVGHAKY